MSTRPADTPINDTRQETPVKTAHFVHSIPRPMGAHVNAALYRLDPPFKDKDGCYHSHVIASAADIPAQMREVYTAVGIDADSMYSSPPEVMLFSAHGEVPGALPCDYDVQVIGTLDHADGLAEIGYEVAS